MHAIAAQVEISKVEARIDKTTGKKIIAGYLKAGEKGICQIKVHVSLYRLNERFVFRNTSLCPVLVDSPCVTKESTFHSI